MRFITYKNIANPHVTIHRDGCAQIKKRGGLHKHDNGEYKEHGDYRQARTFAENNKLPVIDCSFCKPVQNTNLGILIPTDDWNKQVKLSEFLKTREWTVWGSGTTYRIHPPIPPPFYLYFFHRGIVKYRALCFKVAGPNEVPGEGFIVSVCVPKNLFN